MGWNRKQRELSIEVIVSTVVAERGISASAGGTDASGITWTVGEFEVVAERAGLLEILGEHLIPPDVGI